MKINSQEQVYFLHMFIKIKENNWNNKSTSIDLELL